MHEVVAAHADILQRLRYAYGAQAHVFERDIGDVVERYARYVHLLPATLEGHFRHAGGLFRLGLEIGFYALQAADGAIFAGGKTITARSTLEPRWRYATFLAGLCSELHRGLSHLTVTNDHGEAWPAYLHPLLSWLESTKSRQYRVCWVPDPDDTRALNVVAMAHIVTPPILQYLAEGNRVVIPHFMASASGTVRSADANTLDQLVRRSAALVVERDRHTEFVAPALTCDAALACQVTEAPENRASPPRPEHDSPPETVKLPSAARAVIAPARLHPAVRAALRQIVSSPDVAPLPEPSAGMEHGLFVPLREFEQRSVDPSLAVRALSEAGMLARDPGDPRSWTCARVIAGERLLGVLLASRSVSGQEENALAATSEGGEVPA